MSISLFTANEIVTRAKVNERLTGVNDALDTLTPVSLYYDNSGTRGTVTLSKSVANYKAVKIYVKARRGDTKNDVTVWNNNSSSFATNIMTIYQQSSGLINMEIKIAKLNVSGTSITWDIVNDISIYNSSGTTSISGNTVSDTNERPSIYCVIGYK